MVQIKMPEIEYVKFGIGSRIGDTILLNEKLKLYPEYHQKVIEHELKHTGKFTLHDLMHDMMASSKEDFKFCLKHPSGFWQYFPATYHKDILSIDINLIIQYLILLMILALFFMWARFYFGF